MRYRLLARIAIVVLFAPLSAIAQERGRETIPLRSLKGGSPQWEALLRACPQHDGYINEMRQLAAGWMDIVKHIRACDLDSVYFYNDPETTGYVRNSLAYLAARSTRACARQAQDLSADIAAISRELAENAPLIARICHADDHAADWQKSQKALDRSIGRICSALRGRGSC
jgi:hypothetical protein